jgi:OmpA-OmpF porin, OOP family
MGLAKWQRIVLLISIMGLAACAKPPRTTATVILPDPRGHIGAVKVSTPQNQMVANVPFFVTTSSADGKIASVPITPEEIRKRFPIQLLSSQPDFPANYVLYFLSGSETLTPQSQNELPMIINEINRRPVADVVLIGHTDRVGKLEANDALSLRRADAVAKIFIAQGVNPTAIGIAGRGEREPLIPTPDEVPEPRNRRLEVNVR